VAEPVIEIEVVYAAVDRQVLRAVSVAEGLTVRAALLEVRHRRGVS
jgi:putative ubiquitin-RnfH superfamily antitoxin RatB of RatAB toxin-antitoxin module